MFWYLSSQLADYKMADEWFERNVPNAKKGFSRTSDARNFGNIMSEIRRLNEKVA